MSDNQDSAFSSTTDQDNTNFLDQLVGEGKKFKDHEELARGKAESDRYIEELKTELERTKAKSESKLDELLAELRTKGTNANGSNPTNPPSNPSEESKTSFNGAEDIKSLVEETLKERQETSRKEANVNLVDGKLAEMYGDAAGRVVREKAKEMGLSVNDLRDMAAKSPNAFLKLVADTTDPQPNLSSRMNNAVNSEAFGVTNPNNKQVGWSFYRELKRKNPGEFWKRHGEIQSHVEKMGSDKFYNS